MSYSGRGYSSHAPRSIAAPHLELEEAVGRLDGKVVFLTGAGAGIAKATAKACVREGAKVALIELKTEAGERAQREITEAGF